MTPVTVGICSALWQRYPLTAIWWQGVQRITRRLEDHGIRSTVTVAVSEAWHILTAVQHQAETVMVPNEPLGMKWNAAVEQACAFGADYVLILGSDDFLSDPLIDRYAALIRDGWLYMGLSGLYFYEPATQRLAYHESGPATYGNPLGAGRLLHRTLLERTGHRPWSDTISRRLDTDMRLRLDLPPAKLMAVTPEEPAVDVKTETNLWGFDRLRVAYGTTMVEAGHPRLEIPEWEAICALGRKCETA
jgi:hypothetical protein